MTVMIQGLRADQIVRRMIDLGFARMPESPVVLDRQRRHESHEREKARRRRWMKEWRFKQRVARLGYIFACGQLFFPWASPCPSEAEKPILRKRSAKSKPFCRFRRERINPAQLLLAFWAQIGN